MRGRAWRISISEKILIKRLEKELYTTYQWYTWTSKDKDKYSPNRSTGRWGRAGDNTKTREWNKRYLLKILKENGFK